MAAPADWVSRDGWTKRLRASSASDAVAGFARDRRTGALTQLPGTDACSTEDGSRGACADGLAHNTTAQVAVSRQGRNVYVVASDGRNAWRR